ncbi:TPA: class I SAM-dependent methyltransferase family protein [Candidatus Woesearchaeota archaeon]|nr:class I SAM-dependent methyltransferase family protein [Candidatus Woesearchaeota archaeon]
MLAARTPTQYAEKVKQFILKKKVINSNYKVIREMDFLFFPLTKKITIPHAVVVNTKFSFPLRNKVPTIDELLKTKLTPHQFSLLPRSQEIIGTILILEIPPELHPQEKMIAEAYLQSHPHVTTVVKKSDIHGGIFRTRKVKIIAGKRSKETVHMESGVKMKLHLEKTYFSARSSNERLRIARQVKPNELILVMFSGIAPYPLVLAKHSPAQKIYGVEFNPLAHQYALENVILNNLDPKIIIYRGDVRIVLPKIPVTFDRIIMPLPKTGDQFLGLALSKAKKSSIIHLYDFIDEESIPSQKRAIQALAASFQHRVAVRNVVTCGQFSPKLWRVCFDVEVLK